jgi:hypothetical protein
VFCASSQMITAWFSVRPRMYASGHHLDHVALHEAPDRARSPACRAARQAEDAGTGSPWPRGPPAGSPASRPPPPPASHRMSFAHPVGPSAGAPRTPPRGTSCPSPLGPIAEDVRSWSGGSPPGTDRWFSVLGRIRRPRTNTSSEPSHSRRTGVSADGSGSQPIEAGCGCPAIVHTARACLLLFILFHHHRVPRKVR